LIALQHKTAAAKHALRAKTHLKRNRRYRLQTTTTRPPLPTNNHPVRDWVTPGPGPTRAKERGGRDANPLPLEKMERRGNS
jgi:hypothetical protein